MEDQILLVEDDVELGHILKDFFESNGLSVLWAEDGETAIQLFEERHPRLILLDVMLPLKNGFEVATEIRRSNSIVPIIFMTGTVLDKENYDKAYKLLGAINYIEKPVNPHNALAQIQSLLHPVNIKKYTINNHRIIIDNQLLTIDNKEFQVRDKEILVFSLLLENVNSTVTRNDILLKVWDDNDVQLNNLLDTSISHIKKVLKDFPFITIKTIYATGYKLLIKEGK